MIDVTDVAEIDAAIEKIKKADIDKEFKRRAIELFQETREILIVFIPLVKRGQEIEKRSDALEEKYPALKDYL